MQLDNGGDTDVDHFFPHVLKQAGFGPAVDGIWNLESGSGVPRLQSRGRREVRAGGVKARIVRHNDCARLVAQRARTHDQLELLAESVLSICCFRYRPVGWNDEAKLDALNEAILMAIRARGQTVTSSTRVGGRFAIRPCFVNPRCTSVDADALVSAVLAVGQELAAAA
jgi:glutamate/tyrosine decarboxylase-like PLP-dependent enzyme